MHRLATFLSRQRPGLRWLEGDLSPRRLGALARAAGLAPVRVDLSRARGKDALLGALARALRFPGWFGGNWDALHDCLSDLSWRSPGGVLVLLDRAEAFRAADPRGFATALRVLADAARATGGGERPVLVLVRGGRRPAGVAGVTAAGER